MENLICIIICTIILIGIICVPIVGYFQEKKEFNNGICPKCGGNLELFDVDSQGGKGYNCNKCKKYFCWTNWF